MSRNRRPRIYPDHVAATLAFAALAIVVIEIAPRFALITIVGGAIAAVVSFSVLDYVRDNKKNKSDSEE